MTRDSVTAAKEMAGQSAAEQVSDGDVVGLGTGSTAAHAITHIGRRIDSGLSISGIPTSTQARTLARNVGIPLTTLADATPSVAIDGADQVAPNAILKGGGGAHTHEKIIATAAERVIVICDHTKQVDVIDQPIPAEVLSRAQPLVESSVRELGGEPELRVDAQGPIRTDEANLIIDCDFGEIEDPAAIAQGLSKIPGLVDHGLCLDLADEVHWGKSDGTVTVDHR